MFTRLFWLSSAILFLLIIWKVGPVMIEDYQFAHPPHSVVTRFMLDWPA